MKMMKEVKINGLVHAEWNPRSEAELSADHPEMVKLAASIKKNGLLEPIGVWENIVIYGNRRLEAAKIAGLVKIDAFVYSDIDEATARVFTREENENRFGVDPVKDAALIKQAVERGMDQSEIAAACGVSDATICRRMKLVDLTDEVLDVLKEKKVDTKALEEVASWPKEFQVKNKRKLKDIVDYLPIVHFADVRRLFTSMTMEIFDDSWLFKGENGEKRLTKCKCCGDCTGCQPELFASEDDVAACRCMNAKCYRELEKTVRGELCREAVNDAAGDSSEGMTIIENIWDEPYHSSKAKKPTKKMKWAYVFWDKYSNKVGGVRFNISEREFEENEKKEKEKRIAQEKESRDNEKKQEEIRTSAFKKIESFMRGPEIQREEDEADYLLGILERTFERIASDDENPNALLSSIFWDLGLNYSAAADNIDFDDIETVDKFEEFATDLFGEDDVKAAKAAAQLFVDEIYDCVDSYVYSGKMRVRRWCVENIPELRATLSDDEIKTITMED